MGETFSPDKILDSFLDRKASFKAAVKKARKKKIPDLDALFFQEHQEVFSRVDCLLCARCCKGLGPLLRKRDFARISKSLGIKENKLKEEYLRVDEDGDFVFRNLPCPFLGADFYCLIYEDRPDACRRYPCTDLRKMKGRWSILLKDCETCPAAVMILEGVLGKLKIL